MSDITQGTGAALKRAEQAEESLYESWREAQKELEEYCRSASADAEMVVALGKNVKLAFDMYKSAGATLLSYDKGVDPSKRLAGAMLPQEEAVRVLSMFMRHWRIGIEQAIGSFCQSVIKCKTEVEACEMTQDVFRDTVAQAIKRGIEEARLPGWVIATLEEEL